MRLLFIHSHVIFSPPPCLFQTSILFTPAITTGRAAQRGASCLLGTFIHSFLRNPQQWGTWSLVLQKRNLRLRAPNWQLAEGEQQMKVPVLVCLPLKTVLLRPQPTHFGEEH